MHNLDKLSATIGEVLGQPDIKLTMEDSIDTIEKWDSLAVVQIIMAISSEYNITVSMDSFDQFTSVKKITNIIEKLTDGV